MRAEHPVLEQTMENQEHCLPDHDLLSFFSQWTPFCSVFFFLSLLSFSFFFFFKIHQEENGASVRGGLRGDNSQEEIEERTV